MFCTRREFGRSALLALPGAALPRWAWAAAKPDSRIAGVQIGVIAPYSFGREANDAVALLKTLVDLGLSGVELQGGPAEVFAGAPAPPPRGPGQGGPGGQGGQGGARPSPTPEQQEQQRQRAEAMLKWRLSASMDKFKALRKLYNDAGVTIYGFKYDQGLAQASDEECEYAFNVAEALGADHMTMELPRDAAGSKRVGDYATKRRFPVGYHAHTQASLTAWDEALAQSKYNAINLDAGHYVAGTSQSPIPLIEKHASRIVSMHLKDRKKDNGPNVPWGQGDTPLVEILQLMKAKKLKFPATIELEYPVPEGSTRVAEIGKCLDFCRQALTGQRLVAR
jgi:sugar phosphate isomerase/epimerase